MASQESSAPDVAGLRVRLDELARELAHTRSQLAQAIGERDEARDRLSESERQARQVLDTLPALAALMEPGGKPAFLNQRHFEYYGKTLDELMHWDASDAVHPDDLARVIAGWRHSITTGEPFDQELRERRFDGVYRWNQVRGAPIRDATGAISQWCILHTDIDDLKRAEADLRLAHGHLTEAQRLSQSASYTSDFTRDEHLWSDEFYRICGWEIGSRVTMQRFRDLVLPEDLPTFESVLERTATREMFEYAFRIVATGGAVKHLRGVAHRMARTADRQVFVGAVQDVTAATLAEEALQAARAQLAHVARVSTLSTLTASIAHEVNQPLSGIITNAGTCLRMLDADPPNVAGARETARRTIRDGNRAAEVISRLRAMYSRREMALETMDLNEAAREVLALLLSDLQRNRVTLHARLQDDLPAIKGDRTQLQQVILNLLRNASDAMAGIEDRPRLLELRTMREDDLAVRLSVRDAGAGIADIDKLFDAFYTTKSEGMGIGLSVSRSIIERHEGRLWAERNDGPGATFSFSIPCAAPPNAQGEEIHR